MISLPGFIGCTFLTIFLIVINLINVNPYTGFWFYAIIIGVFMLLPCLIAIIEYVVTNKTIALEETGVAQYNRKNKLVKMLAYEEIEYIEIKKNEIIIFSNFSPDFPYLDIITSFTKSLFKFFTSKDFRKRWTEYRIDFRNHKKDYKDYSLPFIKEIAKRSNCEIVYLDKSYQKFDNEIE